jgi:hypothetical protein
VLFQKERAMKKSLKIALWVALLLVSCFVTNRVTRWLVLVDAYAQCGDAVEFDGRKDPLVKFVQTRNLSDGEEVPGKSIPRSLANAGVVHVSRQGRFIIFKLVSRSWLPALDAADSYFVYQVDNKGGGIEELMGMLAGEAKTYHIQYLLTPGWYYWEHG